MVVMKKNGEVFLINQKRIPNKQKVIPNKKKNVKKFNWKKDMTDYLNVTNYILALK